MAPSEPQRGRLLLPREATFVLSYLRYFPSLQTFVIHIMPKYERTEAYRQKQEGKMGPTMPGNAVHLRSQY